jgi:hypothetical protein
MGRSFGRTTKMKQNRMTKLFSRFPGRRFFQTSADEDRFMGLESRLDFLDGIRNQWQSQLPQLINQIDRLTAVEENLEEIRTQWKMQIPQLADQVDRLAAAEDNVISMKSGHLVLENHCNDLTKSVHEIWQRLEVYRTEALLEIRYGKNKPEIHKSKIVKQKRLEEFQISGMKINLGCGHIPLADYLNVDARELPGVDVIADVSDLPFPKGTVQTIFSSHLLEHFPQEELKRRLIPYWFDVLSQGGEFRAIVPDGEAMLKGAGEGTYSFEDFRQVLFGGQDYEGDFHFNLFTPKSLEDILRDVGFINIKCHAKGRPNGQCFEFEMSAAKPKRRSR